MGVQQILAFQDGLAGDEGLRVWPPDVTTLDPSWATLVENFWQSPTGQLLSARVDEALHTGHTIYPPEPFKALSLTPLQHVRVVILGQDPYHGPGQAQGLAFSVAQRTKPPPSLRNIFKELQRSAESTAPAKSDLTHWAEQGVLLLNTSLTVSAGQAASHTKWGWNQLTDDLVRAVAKRKQPVVFMLWGAHAQSKEPLIHQVAQSGLHLVLQANHPSPLSAMRPPCPFVGCNHFAMANAFWRQRGESTIQW